MTTERPQVALEPLGRGVVALLLAAVVTFSPDHSAAVGLALLGGWALLTGSAMLFAARRSRSLFGTLHGAGAVLAGLAALGVLLLARDAAPTLLVLLLVGYAVLGGALDVAAGLRDGAGRDSVVVGAATLLLAVLVLAFPGDPVTTVGLFGAWAAIVGVYLVIGALSVPASRKAHSA